MMIISHSHVFDQPLRGCMKELWSLRQGHESARARTHGERRCARETRIPSPGGPTHACPPGAQGARATDRRSHRPDLWKASTICTVFRTMARPPRPSCLCERASVSGCCPPFPRAVRRATECIRPSTGSALTRRDLPLSPPRPA